MKQYNKFNESDNQSISTISFSSHKEQNQEHNEKQSQKIDQQLILYLFENINGEIEQNSSYLNFQIEKLIQYIQDYQLTLTNKNQNLYFKQIEYYEDNVQEKDQNPIFQILNKVILKMQNGQNKTLIFQNCCLSGIQILYSLNQFSQQQHDQCLLQNENDKITIMNIISIENQQTQLLKQKFSKNLQSFTIIINPGNDFSCSEFFENKNYQQKGLILQNQFFLPIQFNNQGSKVKVTSEIQNLYKYFLKQKIIQFKPKIILLEIEIDNTFEIESYFLKKIIYQLKKISQNQLIIIPIRKSNIIQEQYWQTLIQCIQAINTNKQTKMNPIQENNNQMKAQNYLNWINYISQTNKEKQFYKQQYQSLKVLQKFEQQIDEIQNTQEIFQFPIINSKNLIEYVILEDSYNGQYIEIDSETKYYVSYFKETIEDKLTISIIQNQQLYWGEVNLLEIETKNQNQKKIILEKITVFQDNSNSSFLLDQYKLYQFTIDFNQMNEFVGNVIIFNFRENKNEFNKFLVQNNHPIKHHIKGFTVIKHSDTSFSLLSGCKDGELYQQIGINLDFIEQNSLRLNQYKKENNILPKGYDFPLIVKFEPSNHKEYISNKYLYFESQTRYLFRPLSSKIYQLSFQNKQQKLFCESEQIQNVKNTNLLQQYSKLFRSDKMNLKYQKHGQNKILFEFVVFKKSFERNNFKEFIDIKQNYLHFKFYYYVNPQQTSLQIDLNVNSIILKSQNDKLNSKCLYNNWLEDQNFQHIFLYNSREYNYLLYYQQDKSGQYCKKKFSFYCNENPKNCIPYDEVIINDYHNNIIWIVRKYYDFNYPYFVVYSCHLMRLQEIKDEDVNQITNVKVDKIFQMNIKSTEIDLIGLEVRKRDNVLLICFSTFICQIPISYIIKMDQQQIGTQQYYENMNSSSLIYEIFQIQLNIYHNTPIILLNFNESAIAFFYQYCNFNCLDENDGLYQIEIKAKIWSQKIQSNQNIEDHSISNNDDSDEIQEDQTLIKQQINYKAQNTLIIAKFISIQLKGQIFYSLILLEEEFRQFYVMQCQFTSNQNSIVKLRITHLQQSHGTIQFLKSISTNKYETLFLYDKSTYLIESENNQEKFLNEGSYQGLESEKFLNVQNKQQQLRI